MVCHHWTAAGAIATVTVVFIALRLIMRFSVATTMLISSMMLVSFTICFHSDLFLMFRTSKCKLGADQGNECETDYVNYLRHHVIFTKLGKKIRKRKLGKSEGPGWEPEPIVTNYY